MLQMLHLRFAQIDIKLTTDKWNTKHGSNGISCHLSITSWIQPLGAWSWDFPHITILQLLLPHTHPAISVEGQVNVLAVASSNGQRARAPQPARNMTLLVPTAQEMPQTEKIASQWPSICAGEPGHEAHGVVEMILEAGVPRSELRARSQKGHQLDMRALVEKKAVCPCPSTSCRPNSKPSGPPPM